VCRPLVLLVDATNFHSEVSSENNSLILSTKPDAAKLGFTKLHDYPATFSDMQDLRDQDGKPHPFPLLRGGEG